MRFNKQNPYQINSIKKQLFRSLKEYYEKNSQKFVTRLDTLINFYARFQVKKI